ncbi:MAG: carbohydrate ABC transporter permease, partial [Anaerolineae bacterium]|nr:carbohydrate ABC transporter permease [Anaerolineae bacterium]
MAINARNAKRQRIIGDILVNGTLILLVLLWTIPTLGLLVSSFRTREEIQSSGWWRIFPHRTWVQVEEFQPDSSLNRDGVMNIRGVEGTFEQFRAGITAPDGKTRLIWIGNKRLGRIQVQELRWTAGTRLTTDNYGEVLAGKTFEIRQPDGSVRVEQGSNFLGAFLNSLTVTVPATVIPILIAAFAAYGFAWMRFPGRKVFFIMIVALLVVPLQIALVPILRDYVKLQLNGTFLGIWLAHTGFGLPCLLYTS